jgi:hypothetical protein
MFGCQIMKVNDRGNRQSRIFVMTPNAIYNFKSSKFVEAQRVMYIKDLEGATRSSQSQQLILQFVDECDYLIDFPIANRCGFFTQVGLLFCT